VVVLLISSALGLNATPTRVAYANSIVVNTTLDTSVLGDGLCSLNSAIRNANADLDLSGGDCPAGSGADTITFGVTGTITSTVIPIDITDDLTLAGPGAANLTLTDNVLPPTSHILRLLRVANGITLNVQDLTVADASGISNSGTVTVTNSTFSGNDIDFSNGGAIEGGTVFVEQSTFLDNSIRNAICTPGVLCGAGGAIMADTVTVTNSTFSGNHLTGGGGAIYGGTVTVTNSTFSGNIGRGGAIYNNSGDLTVTDSTFSDNQSDSGGAIFNFGSGTVTVSNSAFTNNSATDNGGAISCEIYSFFGPITVSNSAFTNNSAGDHGGAIFCDVSPHIITGSSFSGNRANTSAGALFVREPGTADITDSTFSGNQAGYGGAIQNTGGFVRVLASTFSSNSALTFSGGGINNLGGAAVTNSTFSGNSAATRGGGIFNDSALGVTNSTFADNRAPDGGGIYNNRTATLRNTIVANSPDGGNCSGTITDGGHNLQSSDATCGASIPTADPLLGPLAANGGPTLTQALLPGSPAIDAVPLIDCTIPADQRGAPRPQNSACDIGAFELGPWPPHAVADTASTAEDTPATIDVLANDSDPNPTDLLTVTAVLTPTSGTASISGTTQVVYTPTLNFNGTDVFSYSVSDGIFTESATITVTITPVNDGPPTAQADTATTPEDTPVHINVLANDSTAPDLNETLSISALTTPAHGVATIGATQAIYTPTPNFQGTDVFSYTVSDGALTATGRVTVTVTPVNDVPSISDIANMTIAAGAATGPIPFTIADVDGDALTVTATSSNTTLVPNANIVLGGSGGSRTIHVTPAAGKSGVAIITVQVSDGHGGTAQDTFVLTVTVPQNKIYLSIMRR
jgi:predicted outer membrane repeat protein